MYSRIDMWNSRPFPPIDNIWELWCLSEGKREDYQNCSVLYCVLKLCTVISTLRLAVLTGLWIGFYHTGPISLYIDLFVFICVYFVCFCFILHSCCIVSTVGWTWWDWSLILRNLSSFSALTLLVGSFNR